MNSVAKIFMGFLGVVMISSLAHAGLLFPYSRLALKDLDQMNKIIQGKIAESQKASGDRVVPLREALQAVFSRPNSDFMIEKVLGPLKNELDDQGLWESALTALVREALGALKNTRAFSPEVQVTYAIFLENMVAEFKPRASDEFERSLLKQIRSAKIVITKEAQKERKLRMMAELMSPSEMADQILKPIEDAEKVQLEAVKKSSP